jgi:hypothetical protein
MSLFDRARETAADIRRNWLVYLVLGTMIAVVTLPFGFILSSIKLDLTEQERDSALAELGKIKADLLAAETRIQHLQSATCAPDVVGEGGEAQLDCSAETREIGRLRKQLQSLSAANTGKLAESAEPRTRSIQPQISLPSCTEAMAAAVGLVNARSQAMKYESNDWSGLKPAKSLAKAHLGNLRKLYPDDATLTHAESSIEDVYKYPIPMIDDVLATLMVRSSQGCANVSEFIKTSLDPQPTSASLCHKTDAILSGLAELRLQTDKSSGLTSKDRQVDTFNALLDESKLIYPNDQFIQAIERVWNEQWHMQTKKAVLTAIDSLRPRLEAYSIQCRSKLVESEESAEPRPAISSQQ